MPKVRLVHAKTTQLMGTQANNQRTLAEIVQDECPSLAEGAVFNPSPFVPGGHAQTIYAFLGFYFYYAHSLISPRFTREIFRLSDGGIVDLDWALCENHTERPIVTILSGVTGTSCDFYVRRCYNEFVKMNYSVLVVHSRGCGSSKLTTPMPFHCGLTTDYREVINSIHARLPNCPLLGLSFSLGANIMAKYIGEEGEQCPLVAGIIVGNPYDMYKVIQHLDSRFFSLNKIYDIAILNFLKTAFNNNKEAIASAPIDFNVPNITNSTTIMEFTEEMTRKAFGYKSAKHLLDESSSGPFLDNIRIPVMFLNSLDDPICIEPLITYEKFINNPYLMLALTEHGGHIGYMGGTWPTSWIEHPVSQFFKAMLKHNAPAAQ
ncbi:Alpha/Beta hydrolase protein [Kickxella alabastrina]|uniref:Alpha/Beta hydrolase protein n=1 Tax=Kickxella alabastrina TaxID=61397 RepID=UPI00221FA9BC|nr:Alpha/Beta hydrolase protein [Kickxella alabastrina]KAI7829123.1 Alpha/Beta hydrolase protein [Kickxella alabastrina]KAJ1936154.1 hypothetical protein GGF37_005723 [Kickxella alabastrina]